MEIREDYCVKEVKLLISRLITENKDMDIFL